MVLRDFIQKSLDTACAENAVKVFKKNEELYKGKSDAFIIRITADELGITKDNLCAILSENYDE